MKKLIVALAAVVLMGSPAYAESVFPPTQYEYTSPIRTISFEVEDAGVFEWSAVGAIVDVKGNRINVRVDGCGYSVNVIQMRGDQVVAHHVITFTCARVFIPIARR